LKYTHFPLHPEVAAGGLRLVDLFKGRAMDVQAAQERLREACAAEGLEFVARERTYNTRMAQELGVWAEGRGHPEVHEAFFRATFVDGVNTGDRDAVVAVVAGLGLDAEEARAVLAEGSSRVRVDADWSRARQLGITGVPTYVSAGRGVVGAQPYATLVRLAELAGAQPR